METRYQKYRYLCKQIRPILTFTLLGDIFFFVIYNFILIKSNESLLGDMTHNSLLKKEKKERITLIEGKNSRKIKKK
jgi:hypothetical protein